MERLIEAIVEFAIQCALALFAKAIVEFAIQGGLAFCIKTIA